MHETKMELDQLILVGIDTDEGAMAADESLLELKELVETTGAVVSDMLMQKREYPHPGHYLGKGKIDELKDLISLHNATGIVCDDGLSAVQLRNLSNLLDVKILDRTLVILDIFASRASSAEGKVQVELAQQKYRLSRLSGLGKSLSRLGGGIGTRGPGEKKLETDRRHIRNRISELEDHLKQIELHRAVLRDKRERNSEIVISLVGYTNAGKSTLLNCLSDSSVYASNQLFATLDTTARSISFGNSSKAILTDTVGFISKLPHNLIKAFRSTLDELKYSDILLHVVDASSPSRSEHMAVVYSTLKELSVLDKPIITIYNKMDRDVDLPLPSDIHARKEVKMSALSGEGKDILFTAIEGILQEMRIKISALIPYNEGALSNMLRQKSEIISEEYVENGLFIEAYVNRELYNRLSPYMAKR